jgi:hydrogenase maturation protease
VSGPRSVTVAGVEVGHGSRVVLRPGEGADIFDRAVAGKVATVGGIHETMEGVIQLAVVLEEDPGRDMGERRQPGHRFFFSPDEVEPLAGEAPSAVRVLVAGIGNVFMGDDGFGVEVARRLSEREQPRGVEVADFGIRGLDLVYALGEGYDAAVFVDAVPRGEPPGTLFVIEPEPGAPDEPVALDAHGMDPVKVLALASQLGDAPDRVLVVGCEPAVRMTGEEEEVVGELSEPVRAALDEAVNMVETLVAELAGGQRGERA